MLNLNGIKVKNRFFIAAGPAKYGRGYKFSENPMSYLFYGLNLVKPELFGGVTTKTLTLLPHLGNYRRYVPRQVLKKLDDGWANRFGWNNCGIDYFVEHKYPKVKNKLSNLIISIGAVNQIEEIFQMIEKINRIKVLAVELNISCPHVKILFRDNRKKLEELFTKTVKLSLHPLIAKLGPEDDAVVKAIIAEQAGINAVSLINTIPMFIENFGDCGRSGPGIKKIALEKVEEISSAVKIPIIGGGGIMDEADCREFFIAGARAVFFASVFFTHPFRPQKIVNNNLKKEEALWKMKKKKA